MPNSHRPKHVSKILNCWKTQCPEAARKPCWLRSSKALAGGLDIYGFFLSEVGLGHSARLYHAAAVSQGLSVNAINRELPGRQAETSFETLLSKNGGNSTGLSIDGLVGFGGLSRQVCRLRKNIALPLWELEAFPARRLRNLADFDELWAPSNFIKENLETATGRKVSLVRHPLHIPDRTSLKTDFSGPLRVLFFFDFDSFPARKNPEGAVKAFQAAFVKGEDVVLTIKTRGAADSGRRAWLVEQAAHDNRITIIDKTLSSEAISRLMTDHDVFLSLHRSEGFGLGCAEALAIGNIVVATDYGGTRDFISERTGFPVEWRKIPVKDDEYIECAGATWADPRIEHAAHRLREIYDAPQLARTRALFGHEELRRQHAVEVVGQRMHGLLTASGPLASWM